MCNHIEQTKSRVKSVYKGKVELGRQESSYGVKVAHGTLNPLVGVRFAVGARFLFFQ